MSASHGHPHGHEHDHHGHDHGNGHDDTHILRRKEDAGYLHDTVGRTEHEMDYFQIRVVALLNVLREKGLVTTDEMRRSIEDIEAQTPALGAKVVARAWADPGFKKRLFMDAKEACLELGVDTSSINHLVVLENTGKVHHMVTCTLCSCYPRPLLGQPPTWYKAYPYRAKSVVDPRGALNDLGYNPPEGIELVVVDSNADCRYLIMPRRPQGTEGWSEEKLALLVTRDSMIGVGDALTPAEFEARPTPV
ncbi:MAG: nitrile hydratase subunit alpha [Candidatus Tectomicrobia bacterium]|uniref:Nitrile hydratase subunit alpha n=1 Tax=Tectimicrobiota bacterium TaxID=2528274 RepID=A0A933E9U0_UNCTE|nr:nitrile hydratase subunit alpha [Candidatus Tectomicrobia bacterium]